MQLRTSKVLYLIFQSLLLVTPLFGFSRDLDTLVVTNPTTLTWVGPHMQWFEDTEADMSFAEVISSATQEKFIQYNKKVFTQPSSGSAIWLKMSIQNKTGAELWLEAGSHSIWTIDFYRPESTGDYGKPVLTGGTRPDEDKEYPTNFYWLKLSSPGDTVARVFYMRLTTGLMKEFPLQIGTLSVLQDNRRNLDFATGGFIGLMMVMILYNLFLAVATRDNIYLTYSIYVLSFLVTITFANGYPLMKNKMWLESFMVWGYAMHFCVAAFARQYLNLPVNAPILDKILWGFMALFTLFCLLFTAGVPSHALAALSQIGLGLYYFFLLFVGLWLWRKGLRNARYFVLGWTFVEVSIFIFLFAVNGPLPFNLFTRNVIYLGSSMEAIIFSLALADRLNVLRKEKELAQLEKYELIMQQNVLLEKRVALRTAEIHHRVKNSLQIISSLISLKSRQVSQPETTTALFELGGRIFSLGLVHERLYKNENIEVIRLDTYLSEIANYLITTFEDGSSMKLKVECVEISASTDIVIACGLITNELITNSVKHAFASDQVERQIGLSLIQKRNEVGITIMDNGRKNKSIPENFNQSFGFRFVDQLISSKLNGRWAYRFDQGFHATITFEMNDAGGIIHQK